MCNYRLNPDSDPLEIREDFDVIVAGLTITTIVVIIIVVIIVIIVGRYKTDMYGDIILSSLVAMLVVYFKKKNILCFKDSQNSHDVDVVLKEPLNEKVKHHPYARPSS